MCLVGLRLNWIQKLLVTISGFLTFEPSLKHLYKEQPVQKRCIFHRCCCCWFWGLDQWDANGCSHISGGALVLFIGDSRRIIPSSPFHLIHMAQKALASAVPQLGSHGWVCYCPNSGWMQGYKSWQYNTHSQSFGFLSRQWHRQKSKASLVFWLLI